MQPRIFTKVAHPAFIILVAATTLLGSAGFAFADLPPNTKVYYYLHDHLGGIETVLDDKGSVVCQQDYLPYGTVRTEGCDDTEEAYGFTGKERDEETGLMYYGARYYDPAIGRFVSQDPWAGDLKDPQTLNKYSYVMNNPVKYVDPTGAKVSEYQPYFSAGLNYLQGEIFGTYRQLTLRSPGNPPGMTDHPYQCVEVAKDLALSQHGVRLGGNGAAANYGNQEILGGTFDSNNRSNPGEYIVYPNGGSVMPQEDDIISWSGQIYGHVGIIAEVTFEEDKGVGQIYTLEQNVKQNQALFSQPFKRTYNEFGEAVYNVASRLGDKYNVQGWARYENQTRLNGHPQIFTPTPHTPATKAPLPFIGMSPLE